MPRIHCFFCTPAGVQENPRLCFGMFVRTFFLFPIPLIFNLIFFFCVCVWRVFYIQLEGTWCTLRQHLNTHLIINLPMYTGQLILRNFGSKSEKRFIAQHPSFYFLLQVYGGLWLDYGPQLCQLWASAQRSHCCCFWRGNFTYLFPLKKEKQKRG